MLSSLSDWGYDTYIKYLLEKNKDLLTKIKVRELHIFTSPRKVFPCSSFLAVQILSLPRNYKTPNACLQSQICVGVITVWSPYPPAYIHGRQNGVESADYKETANWMQFGIFS